MHPAHDRGRVYLYTALLHHLRQISIADPILQYQRTQTRMSSTGKRRRLNMEWLLDQRLQTTTCRLMQQSRDTAGRQSASSCDDRNDRSGRRHRSATAVPESGLDTVIPSVTADSPYTVVRAVVVPGITAVSKP